MPAAVVNGVHLEYEVRGDGEPVLLIMGTGARARVWQVFQVPALVAAGYRVVTFDNRGTPPSATPAGPYTVEQLVGDTIGLIEFLDLAPCRIAAVSLGAVVAQELGVARPDLVRGLALMGTRGRNDAARTALNEAERLLTEAGVELPNDYAAVVRAFQMLSPQTLNDDRQASLWIDTFRRFPAEQSSAAAYLPLEDLTDRLDVLRKIRVPTLVLSFADDLITPPALGREVADVIAGSEYVEIAGCGHLGYLERPEAVNGTLIGFFNRL
ncbi:alpha/beta fold hydrolase [Virgisporangium aurantiacum]|nr:alpha/beta fold hydrolase [Virgisporangium aurantiacum]